ncbi:EAL domain-containing protein [Evansella sp. AB-P1]|uniref:GGDEF and EAL domain-containing protein n=1 Tax=Evansella sp. AB-P1 TaxID=3037653 RepID=UPI00241BF05B|nr:GGDEF and EAL domain-containing protein [Evansella sp. AB-P1]MDG5788807.1 EAL domain-containing protein [Evansella sp. AB-P1]
MNVAIAADIYKEALIQSHDGIVLINKLGEIEFANPTFLQWIGLEEKEVIKGNINRFITLPTSKNWKGVMEVTSMKREKQSVWLVVNSIERKGEGEIDLQILTFRFFQKSGLDPLTKLPNRYMLQSRLDEMIACSFYHDTCFAVLFIDLDRFKFVNDTLGHSYGDLLLQQVAKRLVHSIGEKNMLFRTGGDEFICLLDNVTGEANVVEKINKILKAFTIPFRLAQMEIHVTISVGMSMYPYDGNDAEVLISTADSAMYRAKKKGRNQFEKANVEVNAGAFERLVIENYLRKALPNGEFLIDYQPQVDLKEDKIIGFEALLRWNQPDLGRIPPSEFIPIAEETGLILPIGQWVLERACFQIKEWEQAGVYSVKVAVNISTQQFLQRNFVDTIKSVINKTRINPKKLELEITEGMIIHDIDAAISILQQLTDVGVKISIDDFGTGYSSLSYLKNLPVNTVKIDRSFVFDIDTNPSSKALTSAITTLAHDLNLHVVAEGVESYQQLSYIKRSSCDVVQGFYFSKPIPSTKVVDFLKKMKQVV